jgi:hypothetical protein
VQARSYSIIGKNTSLRRVGLCSWMRRSSPAQDTGVARSWAPSAWSVVSAAPPPYRKIVCYRRPTEIRVNFHVEPRKQGNPPRTAPLARPAGSPRPGEFGNFRPISKFPVIFQPSERIFRKPGECTPCATLCTECATRKPLRQLAFSPSGRFDRRFAPEQCRIAAIPVPFWARK